MGLKPKKTHFPPSTTKKTTFGVGLLANSSPLFATMRIEYEIQRAEINLPSLAEII